MRKQPRMQGNQPLTAEQLIQRHVEEYRVERLQSFLNSGVQWCATTKSQHARMIRENNTDEAALDLAESLPTQLDHQFAGRQSTLIL